jgi:hypothetical protein
MGTQFGASPNVSPQALRGALAAFWLTAAAIAVMRAREGGPHWAEPISLGLAQNIAQAVSQIDIDEDWAETPPNVRYALFVEMLWICFRYGESVATEQAGFTREELAAFFAGEAPAEGISAEAIKDVETVKGSIEKILDRLPKPLRKLFEALMEVLKLTRGFG